MLTRNDLRGYQRSAVDFIKTHASAALFVDMGLGKTISTLTALVDLLAAGEVKRVLLVAPLRPSLGVWMQEAKKWEHTRKLKFSLLLGPEKLRLEAMHSTAPIHIINIDNVAWLMRILTSGPKTALWPYDTLVVDESTTFKNVGAQRFRSIRRQVGKFKHRIILTGKPMPKSLLDIWTQAYLLDEGAALGNSIVAFRQKYFTPQGYMGYDHAPDQGAETRVSELISPMVLTLRSEDWLELPPIIKQDIYVDLPSHAMALYRKMEKEMFLELEKGVADAPNAAAVSAKCWQIANGALIVENSAGERTWQAIHDAKLDALDEIVEGTNGNILIAYWFRADIARLKTRYPKAPNLSDTTGPAFLKLVDEWNAGKHPIMLLHPQSAGHGNNLQFGGNALVFFSMLWNHDAYSQVCERIGASRQAGLRDHVMYKHILARNTIDEVMLEAQRARHSGNRRMIQMLMDYKDRLELL